jgi:hypothetical protein
MSNKRLRSCLSGVLLGTALQAASAEDLRFGFDREPAGHPPPGWTIAATDPGGPLAEWQIKADPEAPSAPNVLAITTIHDDSGGVFNLCWVREVVFQDGVIEAIVRADSGRKDQGGGLIWRAQDADNYYVARFNPLEDNFRLYSVKEGRRKQLASAAGLGVKSGEWFKLKIVHQGDKIEAYLNGRKYLEATDSTLTRAGGIGFWSKADAASSFDDLVVTTQ